MPTEGNYGKGAADLAVLGSDPRFGGGGRALAEAFWTAARGLGRRPALYSLAYRGLADGDPGAVLEGEHVRGLPGLDGVNQLVAGLRLAPRVRGARSLWVVSPIASHGYAAARSRRRYGVWVATTLESEWAARQAGVDRPRRIAHAASARTLRRLERETLGRAACVYATSAASGTWIAKAGGLDEREVGRALGPCRPGDVRPIAGRGLARAPEAADDHLRRPRRRPAQEHRPAPAGRAAPARPHPRHPCPARRLTAARTATAGGGGGGRGA